MEKQVLGVGIAFLSQKEHLFSPSELHDTLIGMVRMRVQVLNLFIMGGNSSTDDILIGTFFQGCLSILFVALPVSYYPEKLGGIVSSRL
jgi:hypothetical protein